MLPLFAFSPGRALFELRLFESCDSSIQEQRSHGVEGGSVLGLWHIIHVESALLGSLRSHFMESLFRLFRMLPVHAKWNMLTPKGEKEIPALAGGRRKKSSTFGFIKLVLHNTTGD